MISSPVLISVGLPVFNGQKYLKEAIDSILAQTYPDFELIICDNASTDETEKICRSYAATDTRIRYFRNPQNLGAAYNYNRVFELSTGKFFKWAAADDIIAPDFLLACLFVMEHNEDVVLCYPNTVMINENSEKIEDYSDLLDIQSAEVHERYMLFHARLRKRDKCNAIFGLMRSSALKKTRLIDRFVGSDTILLSELILSGKFIEVEQPLFFRREHADMSIRAYTSTERTVWFDTQQTIKRRAYFHWRTGFEFMRSVWHLAPGFLTRIRCTLQVIIWVGWRRKLLWAEARSWLIQLIQRLPKPILNFARWLRNFGRRSYGKQKSTKEGA